jgi:hypothetical protein
MAKVQFYEDNVLNAFDNYTYKWKVMMMHPDDVSLRDSIVNTNRYRVIAESGVESEINIQSVVQNLKLVFNKESVDRNGFANVFSFTFVEPMGATLYSRIYLAAQELGIENHLQACYLLELRFIGYDENGSPVDNIAGPFYYNTIMTALDFSYSDGGTTYRADMLETDQEAYKKLMLFTKEQITITASKFGEFLEQFTSIINEQEEKEVLTSTTRLYSNTFEFGSKKQEWNDWAFDAGSGPGGDLESISVTGVGTLTFVINQGTSITDSIIMALMCTTNFRKLPTANGGFHKDNPDDPEAKPSTWKDLSEWFVFETEVDYDKYDFLSKNYTKSIKYNIKQFIVPELVHDAVQHDIIMGDESIQMDRIKNIVGNDLLKKRFDYHFTGLNTEVLNLDVYLNHTYYQIQAVNQGTARTGGIAFPGAGSKENELALLKGQLQENKAKLSKNESRRLKLEQERENFQSGSDPGSNNPNEMASKERSLDERKQKIKEEKARLEERQNEIAEQIKALQPLANKEARLRTQSRIDNVSGDFYITQSDVVGSQAEDSRSSHPLSFNVAEINSKATNGPEDGDTNGALFLGAVDINLNSLADLMQQQITVRGDPYWLGRPRSTSSVLNGAEYEKGGPCYFLNMNFPTYPDESSGLMNIPEANFGIVGVYRVIEVDAQYQDGQFTMNLTSYRDVNTNVGKVWTFLQKGEIDDKPFKSGEPFKPGDEQGEGDAEGSEDSRNTGPSVVDPENLPGSDGNGVLTESQLNTSKIRNQSVANDLKQILIKAGQAAGVNVDVTSGGQPAKGTSTRRTGSTRHDNGHAADVQITTANGRVLDINNAQDLPIIQNFLTEAKKAGATGIGAGNGYMGDNTFHIDNASQYGQGTAGYWGGPLDGGTYRARNAPQWLKDIMTG